jgi:hypothetical protein
VEIETPNIALTLLLPVRYRRFHLTELQANRKLIPIHTRQLGATLYAQMELQSAVTLVEARYVNG